MSALMQLDADESMSGMSAMSKDELREFILDGMTMTAEGIRQVAKGLKAWVECGFDIDELRPSIPQVDWIWKIACEQVSVELFVSFAHHRYFAELSRLPRDVQDKIAEAPHRIPVIGADGQQRIIAPAELSANQFRLVFDTRSGRIRTPAEQRTIQEEAEASRRIPEADVQEEIAISRDKKYVTITTEIGRVKLSRRKVDAIYRMLHQ